MDTLEREIVEGSLAIVQEVFRQYGPVIVARAGKSESVNFKEDSSPVTETDIEVEEALQAALARRFPDLLVFGEETGYPDVLPPAFWMVDPIDGTKSFIENVPTFTSMAALVKDGRAVASVIYNPSNGDMFVAEEGKGTYKNGTRLDLAVLPLPGIALCKEQFIDELNGMLRPKQVVCQESPTGGGYGFTMVLDGLAAARFQLKGRGYIHDYAPGALLVREAGGEILPIVDDVYTYELCSFVACHPELSETVRPHLARLRALEME